MVSWVRFRAEFCVLGNNGGAPYSVFNIFVSLLYKKIIFHFPQSSGKRSVLVWKDSW